MRIRLVGEGRKLLIRKAKLARACEPFDSKLILPVFYSRQKELTKINFIKYLRLKIFQYVVLYPEWLLLLIPAFPQE
jgi:hypothetical protein